jgi:hypothetical protein
MFEECKKEEAAARAAQRAYMSGFKGKGVLEG